MRRTRKFTWTRTWRCVFGCRIVWFGVYVSHLCVSRLIHAGTKWNLSWCHSVEFLLFFYLYFFRTGVRNPGPLYHKEMQISLSLSLSQSSAVVQPLREGQTAGAELFGLSLVHTHTCTRTLRRHTTYQHTTYAHAWTLCGISPVINECKYINMPHTNINSTAHASNASIKSKWGVLLCCTGHLGNRRMFKTLVPQPSCGSPPLGGRPPLSLPFPSFSLLLLLFLVVHRRVRSS